jgi:prophage maintenance system killer protein
MDTFLRLNGFRIAAPLDESEAVSLAVASHTITRDDFTAWVQAHTAPLASDGG